MLKEEIIKILTDGGVVVMRSDTVYGIFACIDREDAIRRIFDIKRRQSGKGLPVLCADMEMVKSIAEINPDLERELSEIWPASITAVLPSHTSVSSIARGGSPNIAIRIPSDDSLVSIIRSVGVPLVATSANRSGESEARSIEDLRTSGVLDEVDGYLDGGIVDDNIKPSKIIDFTVNPHVILRQ